MQLERLKKLALKYKGHFITAVVALVIGIVIGLLFMPKEKEIQYQEKVKIEYQERIEYRDRIVEKIVQDRSAAKNQRVKIITKYIERPDGTKETVKEEMTETHEEEKVKVETEKQQETEIKKEIVIQKEVQIEYKETPVEKNWHVAGSIGTDLALSPVFGGSVERRIIGPFFLGLRADTQPSAAILIGFDF